MAPIDYSKWKKIEVSDDEDDTHPNIDNASLFRWRHQARVERMKEMEEKKKSYSMEKEKAEAKLRSLRERLDKEGAIEDEVAKAEAELKKAQSKVEEVEKEEKLQPWNVDTISKDGWEKTIINKPQKIQSPPLTDEEREQRYKDFVGKNEKKIKEFGMLSRWDDCKNFLMNDPNLCCEETANYLTIWCLNLEMEEKHSLMEHVAKQAIAMQYMLELAKQLDIDVRACISSFFTKIQTADQPYQDAFNNEIEEFKNRIRNRAKARIEAAMKEVEEEERKARLGPGGLDPLEVIETLPEELRLCFETQDTEKLKEVLMKIGEKDAEYHMKRCVASGLWVTEKSSSNVNADDASGSKEGGENIYSETASSKE